MSLSDFTIKNAEPREKPYRLADGDGLYIQVRPNGSKLWQMKYRYDCKDNILSFGQYPVVTLREARQKRDEAKTLLKGGISPSQQRQMQKQAHLKSAANTFKLLADEYIDRLVDREMADTTLSKVRWLLHTVAAPLADRPIREINAAEVLLLLQKVEKTGRRETAKRLRGVIGSVFRHAVVTLRAETDPTVFLRGALLPPKTQNRAAITDEQAFGRLMLSIDEYDGYPSLKAALQFLALTCVRPGEVRGAVRDEFDLDKAVWRIPAERMKMRHPHEVPLSKQALAVLDEVWSYSDHASLVFPSIRSNRRPLSENSMNAALRRLGYTKDEVTAHGFRATASTILNSRGYDSDVIEAVLAHQDRNTVRRAYNRSKYWPQRVALMQDWADLLDDLKREKPAERRSGRGR